MRLSITTCFLFFAEKRFNLVELSFNIYVDDDANGVRAKQVSGRTTTTS